MIKLHIVFALLSIHFFSPTVLACGTTVSEFVPFAVGDSVVATDQNLNPFYGRVTQLAEATALVEHRVGEKKRIIEWPLERLRHHKGPAKKRLLRVGAILTEFDRYLSSLLPDRPTVNKTGGVARDQVICARRDTRWNVGVVGEVSGDAFDFMPFDREGNWQDIETFPKIEEFGVLVESDLGIEQGTIVQQGTVELVFNNGKAFVRHGDGEDMRYLIFETANLIKVGE